MEHSASTAPRRVDNPLFRRSGSPRTSQSFSELLARGGESPRTSFDSFNSSAQDLSSDVPSFKVSLLGLLVVCWR